MKSSSFLSCYTCGLEEQFFDCNMRRASTSRREHPLQSPLQRARSSERLTSTHEESGEENFLDAHQEEERLAESTDNDSLAPEFSHSDEDDRPTVASSRSQRRMHERAMSDPFDTQEVKDAILQVQNENFAAEKAMAYPTLMRYPVAETRNKNCWSEPPVTIFSVRGPQYFVGSKKKKQTSGPYLLSARGADIFLFDRPVQLEER